MLTTQNIRAIYEKIQKQLFYMIPEKWDRVYLYASIIDRFNGLQTGEMFFYYYPKGLLKKNPINVYEIPAKFNLDEKQYMNLAEKLYDEIKKLREEMIKTEEIWTNITISIEKCQFKVEYKYDNIANSNYTSYDRHIIWRYQYLKVPLELFSRTEREMIQKYFSDEEYMHQRVNTYNEGIYKKGVSNIVEYNIERSTNKINNHAKVEWRFNKKIKSDQSYLQPEKEVKKEISKKLKKENKKEEKKEECKALVKVKNKKFDYQPWCIYEKDFVQEAIKIEKKN